MRSTPPSGPSQETLSRHRELAPYLPVLAEIEARGAELAGLADAELDARAAALRARAGELAGADRPLGPLAPEHFALVGELAHRELGQRPFPEQVVAGLALDAGNLVEMQTGEGKTLAAVAPVALAALAGRGVHVLTFNDYLARRDAAWMGPIYARLGLSVGVVQEGLDGAGRRRAYGCDLTYLTVKEAGFDLLRDGLCLEPGDRVHRPFHLALVDEADSILIDEARIPLVIAGADEEPAGDLARLADLARRLRPEVDFATDEYAHNVFLTEAGSRRAEAELGCGDLFAAGNLRLQAELRNALHAERLLRRDVDYIVRGGRVELVDELTGRVAENRHWPDGLQAALETKEGLVPRPEGRILGSIAVQHLLRKYPRLAGMTATARPAAGELADVYGLAVVTVPTHRPSVRVDHPDVVFVHREAKRRTVVEEIARVHATGRPILVGTVSVEESERLAADLAAAGVACRVLNAKYDAEEAAIVAEAGAVGAVTISTNMAGRGTDIRLGGADGRDRERVAVLGGLYVLGTNRHDSRRIDDQLRGRAGRQGDPGSSRFYISLEDDLLARYGIARLVPARLLGGPAGTGGGAPGGDAGRDSGHPEAEVLDLKAVHREVAHVQRVVEGEHGDVRRRLLTFAQILEHQREEIQTWRRAVLEGRAEGGLLAERCPERWTGLRAELGAAAEATLAEVERRLTLLAIDRAWSDHLAEMTRLRDEVHLLQIGGHDPFAEFYRAAGAGFDALPEAVDETVVETFGRLAVTADGVDWTGAGLRGPSSTWTYLVDDNVFGGNAFLGMANRASIGLWGVLLLGPVLFVWGLGQHWRRRRQRRAEDADDPG